MIVADVTIKLSLHSRKHGQRYINPAYVSLTTDVLWLCIVLLFLSTEANSKKQNTSERDAFLTQSTSSRSSYRWMGEEARVSMRRVQSKSTRSTRLGSSSWNWCATAHRRTEETVCSRLSTNDSVMISNWIYVTSRHVTCRSESYWSLVRPWIESRKSFKTWISILSAHIDDSLNVTVQWRVQWLHTTLSAREITMSIRHDIAKSRVTGGNKRSYPSVKNLRVRRTDTINSIDDDFKTILRYRRTSILKSLTSVNEIRHNRERHESRVQAQRTERFTRW